MAENITNPVSYGGKAGQLAIGKGIVDAFNTSYEDKLKRDYFQQAILDEENKKYEAVYDSINTIPQTGIDTFDTNINKFFNEGADKIFETKNLVSEGYLTQQEGAKIISETRGYINTFKTLTPKFIEQIKYYNNAKQNGTLSRVNDNGMAAMLDAIANGSGDVKLLEKDGKMYLSGSGSIDTTEGKENWNYTMNLANLGNLLDDPGFAMIKTIPTYTDLGIDELFESQKGLLKGAMDTVEYEDWQGNIKTKRVYNPKKLGELMVKSGMYADLLNDPEMGVVWSDMVHGSQELGSFKQWDPNNQDMRRKMEAWLIDKAILRNIPSDEIIDVQSVKSGGNNNNNSGTGAGGFVNSLLMDIYPDIKEFIDLEAIDPIVGENIDSEGGGGAAGPGKPGKKLTASSFTLDPEKTINLLQRYTTGTDFYSVLDDDSIGDLVAQSHNVIDNLTESDFTDTDSDYNDYYDSELSLDENKQNLKDAQTKAIRETVKSLTPGDGKARNVVVIRKGELKPTKVKGDIYSVLKEVIENSNYLSGKDVGEALKLLNYYTNEDINPDAWDVQKWGEYDMKEDLLDSRGKKIITTYNSGADN